MRELLEEWEAWDDALVQRSGDPKSQLLDARSSYEQRYHGFGLGDSALCFRGQLEALDVAAVAPGYILEKPLDGSVLIQYNVLLLRHGQIVRLLSTERRRTLNKAGTQAAYVLWSSLEKVFTS